MRYLLFPALLVAFQVGNMAQAQPPGAPRQIVRGWYERFLGREPDYPAAQGWVDQLRSGTPPANVLVGILASDEFFQNAGSTPEGYVESLFQHLLGRPATPAELSYWANLYEQQGRQSVALGLLNQYPQSWQGPPPVPRNDGAIRGWYKRYLHRPPDEHDYRYLAGTRPSADDIAYWSRRVRTEGVLNTVADILHYLANQGQPPPVPAGETVAMPPP